MRLQRRVGSAPDPVCSTPGPGGGGGDQDDQCSRQASTVDSGGEQAGAGLTEAQATEIMTRLATLVDLWLDDGVVRMADQ